MPHDYLLIPDGLIDCQGDLASYSRTLIIRQRNIQFTAINLKIRRIDYDFSCSFHSEQE